MPTAIYINARTERALKSRAREYGVTPTILAARMVEAAFAKQMVDELLENVNVAHRLKSGPPVGVPDEKFLQAIFAYANDRGECEVSMKELAEDLGMSVAGINSRVQKLRRNGDITQIRKGRGAVKSIYHVNFVVDIEVAR